MAGITDQIIEEILSGRTARTPMSGRGQRSAGRGQRQNRRGGFSPQSRTSGLNLDDLGAREQYRYRLAQTAVQIGADEDTVSRMLEGNEIYLPAYEEAIKERDLRKLSAYAAMSTQKKNWIERNVPGTLGKVLHEVSRPVNAFTGGLTEILRDDPGLNPAGLASAFGRGAGRGFMHDEQYGTKSILDELEGYEIGGRRLPVPEGGALRVGAEFTGDVIFDPLTYLGIKAIPGTQGGRVVDDAVEQARNFVNRSQDVSEVNKFRNMPRNQRGPIAERIIDDIYNPRKRVPKGEPGAGSFRRQNAQEFVHRETPEIYDPVLNRGVPRPKDIPDEMPKTLAAKERLVESILEKDDLIRQRTGVQQTRLRDFLDTQSEAAQKGYVSFQLAGHELPMANNPLTRTMFAAGAGAKRTLGYNKAGQARAVTRALNYRRADWGELPEHIRRQQANYTDMGATYLRDMAKMRSLVDDDEFDMIIEALDAKKLENVDPATLFDDLDQIPLKKSGLATAPGNPLAETPLSTVGDVGRLFDGYMDELADLERAHYIDPPVGGNFPLHTKGERKLSAKDKLRPIRELRERNIQFVDPLQSFAEDISYRLERLAVADATLKTLDQYVVKIPDIRAPKRKVTNRETGKVVTRKSEEGSQLHNIQLGDLHPTTGELLRGKNPIDPLDIEDTPFLNSPEGQKLAENLAKEAARNGKVKHGRMEFVPVSKIKNDQVKAWMNQMDYKHNDFLIPKPIADALDTMNRVFTSPSEATKFIRGYDKIMSAWKKAVTVYNPGYHIRNSISDYFLNTAAGVRGPVPYERALKVITGKHKHNQLVAGEVFDPLAAVGDRTARRAMKQQRETIKLAGQTLRTDEAWLLYARFSGSKTGQLRAELSNILDQAYLKGKGKGTNVGAHVTRFSEGREDFMRLAHFLDRFEKEAGKRGIRIKQNGFLTGEARKLAEEVGDKVRVHNLDYGARTPFERDVLSRVVPFYTYLRRNLPLQIQTLLTQPGVISRYPKYQNLFEGLMGNPEEDESTVLMPQWIQESFPWLIETERRRHSGPIGQLLSMFGADDPSGAVVMPMENMLPVGSFNEFNALTDPLLQGRAPTMTDVSEQFRNTLSTVAPAARVPFEIGFAQQTFSGQEMNDPGDWVNYLLGQIPVGRLGAAATGQGSADPQETFSRWLTGLPIRQVSPANEQSEFRRREDALEAVRGQLKNEVNAELRELGLEEVDSLPALDSDELIAGILEAARRRRRNVQYSEEYLANQNG